MDDIALAVAGSNLYVAWTQAVAPPLPQLVTQIWFSSSSDYGATWRTPIRISSDYADARRPNIAVSSLGYLIIVYEKAFVVKGIFKVTTKVSSYTMCR